MLGSALWFQNWSGLKRHLGPRDWAFPADQSYHADEHMQDLWSSKQFWLLPLEYYGAG